MNETIDKLTIEIQSTTKSATDAISNLVNSLDNLKKSLSDVISESSNFSKLKSNLAGATTGLSTKVSTPSKSKQTSSFSQYGTLEQQTKQLGVDLGTAEQISSIRTVNSEISKYATTAGQVVTVNKKIKDGTDSVKVSVNDMAKSVKNGSSIWSAFTQGLSGAIVKFAIFYKSIMAVAYKLSGFIKTAANYQEALNLFTVTMGTYAQQGVQWVNKFSNALYLDPANVMQYMGSFNSLIKGLGVGSSKAYTMSQNLTQLTYDLSSFKNIDIQSAFEKLQSAMSGEIEPLRNVGVALSQATLQQLAYSLGIKENVANMSEATKTQLRYIQILKSSKEWQGDMARTLVSPANALRILQQQFTLLGRAIGNIFIPVLMLVIPYIMALTKWLTALGNKIANFVSKVLGIKIVQDIDYSKTSNGIKGIGDSIADTGDSAAKTTSKLNTMLAAFDDLNVVQTQSESTSGGTGTGVSGDDLDLAIGGYDALADLSKKFSNNVESARKNLKKIIPIVGIIAGLFAGMWILKKFANFVNDIKNIGGAFKSVKNLFFPAKAAASAVASSSAAKDISNNVTAFKLPDYKTILKGMAEIATIIGGTIVLVEAIGLFMKIPGVKEIATSGVELLKIVFNGLLSVSIPIALMSGGVVLLSKIPVVDVLKGLANMSLIVAGIPLLISGLGFLSSVAGLSKLVGGGLDLIKQAINGIWSVITPLAILTAGIIVLGFVTPAIVLAGMAGLALVLAGLPLIFALMGALAQIPGLTYLVGEGGKLLVQVGSVIGDFAGSIVNAFMGKVFDGIPDAGKKLADFMQNAQPFFDGVSKINSDVAQSVNYLASAILQITAADVLNGLFSWATGGASLTKFGTDLESFAPHFSAYYDAIKGVDSGVVTASANAAMSLAKFAQAIPNQGGLAAWFAGSNNLNDFAAMLPGFGKNFKQYYNNIGGIDDDVITSSANAAMALVKMTQQIPNQGGLLAWFTGDNGLDKISNPLPTFGKNFKKYYDNITGIAPSVVTDSSNAAQSIVAFTSLIPNQGGLVDLFTGSNSLSAFGKDLASFGESFKNYYNTIKGISIGSISTATNALKDIVNLYISIKNNGLANVIRDFGNALSGSAGNIANFYRSALTWNVGRRIGSSFGNGIASGIVDAIKNTVMPNIKLTSGKKTIQNFKIETYATGGYPTSGDLFYANENGVPEMVGSIGNKTAVANNNQITDSIVTALTSALDKYKLSGNSPTTIYIGNKKVYEGYGDYVSNENDRYGTNTIRI